MSQVDYQLAGDLNKPVDREPKMICRNKSISIVLFWLTERICAVEQAKVSLLTRRLLARLRSINQRQVPIHAILLSVTAFHL
jgi:hypothetical protein